MLREMEELIKKIWSSDGVSKIVWCSGIAEDKKCRDFFFDIDIVNVTGIDITVQSKKSALTYIMFTAYIMNIQYEYFSKRSFLQYNLQYREPYLHCRVHISSSII